MTRGREGYPFMAEDSRDAPPQLLALLRRQARRPFVRSARACSIQVWSAGSVRSSSGATWATDLPSSSTKPDRARLELIRELSSRSTRPPCSCHRGHRTRLSQCVHESGSSPRAAADSTAAPTTPIAGTRSRRVPTASKDCRCGTGKPSDARSAIQRVADCPRCDGWLGRKEGKYGPFPGCSNWPACEFSRALGLARTPARSG